MDAIFEKHNSVRHYCVEGLAALRQSYAWQDRIPASIYWRALHEIETFVPDDFSSLAELIAFLELAAQTALQEALAATAHDYAHQLRRPTLSLARIQQIQRETTAMLLAFIRQPELPTAPLLPYRRVLSKQEAAVIWAAFEERRRTLPKANLYDYIDDASLNALMRRMLDQGSTRLYNLYSMSYFGYELDVSWLHQMFGYDETYWTAPDFSWYIYGEGHGYSIIGGIALEIIQQ